MGGAYINCPIGNLISALRLYSFKVSATVASLLDYKCKASAAGQEVLDQVLNLLNLTEREYFGLRYLGASDQVYWLDPNRSLGKQFKKCDPVHGVDTDGSSEKRLKKCETYRLFFCVKFYPPDPSQLHEETTRYQLFLQIRQDIHHERLPVPLDAQVELGAYALQAEIGDYDTDRDQPGYSSTFQLVSQKLMLDVRLQKKIEAIHKSLRGVSCSEAQYRYLTFAKSQDLYGVDLYGVLGESDISDPYTTDSGYFLGLSNCGLSMIHNEQKLAEFQWEKIVSISKDVPRAGRRDKGGSIIIRVRSEQDKLATFGFRLTTRAACKHFYKTAIEHQKYFRSGLKGTGAMSTPSLSSWLMRIGSKFRSSGRSGSDSVSLRERRRSVRSEPKMEQNTNTVQRNRAQPASTVIYEDDKMTVILGNGTEVWTQLKMPPPENDHVPELQPRNALVSRSLRRTTVRSSSPMSIQSSFSTVPRRVPEKVDDDADSVFSGSSRISRAVSDAETLRKKRKRSTMGENNSSGASEENDVPRQPELRSSVGPERRKGKMPMRHRTVDGSVTQQVLAQMRVSPSKSSDGRSLNLPDRLAEVMQSARSLNYLNSVGLSPRCNGNRQMFLFTGEGHLPLEPQSFFDAQQTSTGPRRPPRNLPLPCVPPDSVSRTAPRSPYLPAPSSPMKATKTFDFHIQSPKLSLPPDIPLPEPPRHIRSLSSSDTTPKSPRNLPTTRSRLRSDSHFNRDDVQLDSGIDHCSPLASPCPVIPPPTPFAEPPAVPARPPHTLKPFPTRMVSGRNGMIKGRTDSFTSAITSNDMEMQPVDRTSVPEATYDCVYGAAGKTHVQPSEHVAQTHLVEVDVHAPHFIGNGHVNGSESLYLSSSALEDSKENTQPLVAGKEIVQNQMYFDMRFDGEPRDAGSVLKTGNIKPVKGYVSQKVGPPVASNYPLAIYSTAAELSPGIPATTSTVNGIPQNSGFTQLRSGYEYSPCGGAVPYTTV
ncbi:band 4.1-like protein 4A isoform X2 [Paramacrobiotus metropolitanus]|nr:band 4.1-like protein 4A isoform X2 [Paramacrobiotus metropolitanus]